MNKLRFIYNFTQKYMNELPVQNFYFTSVLSFKGQLAYCDVFLSVVKCGKLLTPENYED